MTDNRLSTVAPDLVTTILKESAHVQDRVAMMIAEWVVTAAGLVDDRISIGLVRSGEGERGDSPERDAVKAVVDEFDELAWDIQDLIEVGGGSQADYEVAFNKARAANTVWSALDSNSRVAVLDALYEAQAATGADDVRKVVYEFLAERRN